LGVVYATDAAVSKKVKVVGVFPESMHDFIVYPFALVAGKDSAAAIQKPGSPRHLQHTPFQAVRASALAASRSLALAMTSSFATGFAPVTLGIGSLPPDTLVRGQDDL